MIELALKVKMIGGCVMKSGSTTNVQQGEEEGRFSTGRCPPASQLGRGNTGHEIPENSSVGSASGVPGGGTAVVECQLTLPPKEPLHARLATRIAMCVQEFNSEVSVNTGQSTAKGQSVMSLLTLGVGAGESLTVRAEGPDAERVLRMIRERIGG